VDNVQPRKAEFTRSFQHPSINRACCGGLAPFVSLTVFALGFVRSAVASKHPAQRPLYLECIGIAKNYDSRGLGRLQLYFQLLMG
jgi:hypothetical protein